MTEHIDKQEKRLALDELSKVNNDPQEKKHAEDDGHDHAEAGAGVEKAEAGWKSHWDLLLALTILAVLLVLEFGFKIELPKIPSLVINLIAYLLAGRKVLNLAWRKSKRGDIFNEFVLMSVATIGAFVIGEYEEGVAVMVFYQVGEWFQDAAVNRAKRNIKAFVFNAVTSIRELSTCFLMLASIGCMPAAHFSVFGRNGKVWRFLDCNIVPAV